MTNFKKDLKNELEERLRFETLLADISAQFINLPADRIDDAIKDAQRDICALLDLERSVLWQLIERKSGMMLLSHTHQPPESRLPDSPFDAGGNFPWLIRRMLQREIVAFTSLNDLPPEADSDRELLKTLGVKAAIVLPLSVGGEIIGALSFGRLREESTWRENVVKRLQLVAQIFANVLARKQTEDELISSLRFETLLAEISARFVNLPAGRIDAEIEDAQKLICQCLGLDMATLWQWTDDTPRFLILTHVHTPPEGPFRPERIDAQEAFPWVLQKLMIGETLAHNTEKLPPEAARDQETLRLYGIKSSLVVPLSVGGGPLIGALSFDSLRQERFWPEPIVREIHMVSQIFANALARKFGELELRESEARLQVQLAEIESLKQKLEKENIYLREEIELQSVHEEIVGRSPAMKRILILAEQVARTDATVLIEGETGTGKELLARAVHQLSARKDRPLVTVNCASLPPTLIESELFGREMGAYTGAMTRMTGRFETADKATLFLDEIGELPLDVQPKLLRVLEEGSFERLGSTRTQQVDVRIIAATNKDLARQVDAGSFRKDLYFRLHVFPIHLPPLRERPEDIPPLVWTFVKQFEKKMGRRIDHITLNCMDDLRRYLWPGNIRELRNVIERAMIVCSGRTLDIHPPDGNFAVESADFNLEDAERRHILEVLRQTGWRLSGQGGAAVILGIKRTTLQSKMKKLGIRRSAQ